MKRLKHFWMRLKSYISRPKTILQQQLIIQSEIDYCQHPIFIIGIHRSGTSLLRRIINSHPNIACPPESLFLSYFFQMSQDPHVYSGLASFGIEDKEQAKQQLVEWATRYHEAYRISQQKPRWADKTPQYVEYINQITDMFSGQAQFVLLFRHPFDIVYSIYQRDWRFGHYAEDLLLNNALYVKQQYKIMLDFVANNNNYIAIRYEDLIANPSFILQSVFHYLNEPWDEQVLEYHKFEHNYGIEDPIVRGITGFHSNFDKWKLLNPEQIMVLKQELSEYALAEGYAIDG